MKQHTIVLFEDVYHYHFYPFSLTGPVFSLRTGIFSFYERICRQYPEADIKVICREGLKDFAEASGMKLFTDADFRYADKYVFINAAVRFRNRHIFESDTYAVDGDRLIYIHPGPGETADWRCIDFLDGEILEKVNRLGLHRKDPEHRLFSYPWEIVSHAGDSIVEDLELYSFSGKGTVMDQAVVFGDHPLHLDAGAVIEPGAVIDTRSGPVVLGPGATVRPLSYVEGPTWIGGGSLIDGAKIRGNCAFGDVCRIGGEVEASIIQGYSNKHHDGFLGHAFVGSWCNIGAMTTNSDLRNDYRPVKVSQEGRITDTGDLKIGCLIGDHTRIGIGVMINTGTVIGPGCNIYSCGKIIKEETPGFVFGGGQPFREYRLDRFIESVEQMQSRRGRRLEDAERKLLLAVHAATKNFRQDFM